MKSWLFLFLVSPLLAQTPSPAARPRTTTAPAAVGSARYVRGIIPSRRLCWRGCARSREGALRQHAEQRAAAFIAPFIFDRPKLLNMRDQATGDAALTEAPRPS